MSPDTYCNWCGFVLDVDADWYEFDDIREFCSEECFEAFEEDRAPVEDDDD